MNANATPQNASACEYPADGRMAEPGQPIAREGKPEAGTDILTGDEPGQTRPESAAPLMGVNTSNSSRSHASEVAARQRALGKMDAAQRQQIADLESLKQAKLRVLEGMRTLKRGTYYADRRAKLQERLQALQAELALLDSEWTHADEIIEQTKREVEALNVRIKMLTYAHELQRLIDLQAKVNGLQQPNNLQQGESNE